MKDNLYIDNSQIVFSFARNMEIRKRLFEFEDALKDEFKVPFITVAIPDELDPNIPRFKSQSQNGHSKIEVSQSRITLATKYDEKFKLDHHQIEKYIRAKVANLSKLADSENINFIGYIIELGIYLEPSHINDFLRENTGAFSIKEDCKDFSIYYSKNYKLDFYLNVKCSKFKEQKLILHNETKTLRPTGQFNHGISIILDVNTKPFFERHRTFEKSLYDKLNKTVFEIINTKSIEAYLKGEI
ncbi:hypothetical protein SAMN05444380_12740 [Thermophagus xiamenensis]|uniref:TIGR04255 family protein n=2 Tax=Thermophagus xiamenensis TaxID=385682 RepID=A0A1I2FBG8_9BACT|nr:hypothetical protein SAMN05444380_12740 [Thermophagus xiamenensis]